MKLAAALMAAVSLTLVSGTKVSAAEGLGAGARGQRVCDAQWLMAGKKPSVFPHLHTYHLHDPVLHGQACQFGRLTVKATKDAYWKLGWPAWFINSPNGARYGPLLDATLRGKWKRPMSYQLAAGRRANRATDFQTHTVDGKIRKAVYEAQYLITQAPRIHYSQNMRMEIIRRKLSIPPLRVEIWEDCSSSTTGIYWLAGLPDPNGYGYTGYGYTGTQSLHGKVVWHIGQPLSQLRPGDLVFYGRYPYGHVTMYLGSGRVFSHGSEDGPFNLPVLYRTDAFEARRYT